MTDETLTVICFTHRRKVQLGDRPGVLVHVGGNGDRFCSSQQFVRKREDKTDRAGALTAMRENGDA